MHVTHAAAAPQDQAQGEEQVSVFAIALAMNVFFGGAACDVEYSLGMPHDWYVLETGTYWDVSK